MSGNAGIRGYIVQTLICVLDALEADNKWLSVTLEPLDESEKVDIRWKYPNNKTKMSQVKSSQNIIRYSSAQRWCEELETKSPNANDYELILIGQVDEKLSKREDIGKVKIGEFRPLNTKFLIDQASTKVDAYYERKGKAKISSKVRELIIKILEAHFGNSSIVGTEISRSDFDNNLLAWITTIENEIDKNPFASLSPPTENEKVPINHRIAKRILELIGWNQFGENHEVEIFNEHTSQQDIHRINFAGDFENKLKENTLDFVMVSSLHDFAYPDSSKAQITSYLNDTDIVFKDFIKINRIPSKKYSYTDYYSLLFWLTTENSEVTSDFVHHAKDNYKREILNDEINYFLLDNNKANFLISSIITAKNYREDISVKFLYPITEANQSPGKIGQRGLKLPVQYINSSIIPIVKEDMNKISFLMFCADSFSSEALKKLIWLTIRLTSGFGNEYLLYFPDYKEAQNKNEALEIIRSFNEELLDQKIKILGYDRIGITALDSLTSTQVTTSKNETYDESKEQSLINSKHLNEAFINILPYGDILKPFLKTDAITANDLKIFLAKKGIFIKKTDKVTLITLLSTLLFSPQELEDFKSYIDIKDRTTHSIDEFYNIKQNIDLTKVFNQIKLNFDNLTDGLNTSIVNNDKVKFIQSQTNEEEFVLSVITELKDPTNNISVNTTWGKTDIVVRKLNNKLVVITEKTITKDDKLIANRVEKILSKEFQRIGFIENKKIKVMFKTFTSNTSRANFLLSFSNISSSLVLTDADIRSIKFKFDENTEIPELYKDKADKDLVINFDGRGLKTLKELSEKNAKESIFLEEMCILYKFQHLNINGSYTVTYNFSNALKNKPDMDGAFKSEPFLSKTKSIKSLVNVNNLEKELAKEIERLKIEKLKEFNIIE